MWREVEDVAVRKVLPVPRDLGFVVSGWACHQRSLANGRRQIIGFMTRGDTHRPAKNEEAVAIQLVALTRVLFVDATSLFDGEDAAATYPGLARARVLCERQAHDFLISQIVRLSACDSRGALAHLILELEARTAGVGGSEEGFPLPIGQRALGHALGFSTVHINRSLARLREEGLLDLHGGRARITDRDGLAALALT